MEWLIQDISLLNITGRTIGTLWSHQWHQGKRCWKKYCLPLIHCKIYCTNIKPFGEMMEIWKRNLRKVGNLNVNFQYFKFWFLWIFGWVLYNVQCSQCPSNSLGFESFLKQLGCYYFLNVHRVFLCHYHLYWIAMLGHVYYFFILFWLDKS